MKITSPASKLILVTSALAVAAMFAVPALISAQQSTDQAERVTAQKKLPPKKGGGKKTTTTSDTSTDTSSSDAKKGVGKKAPKKK
jgi:hypothetical protein